jgi:anti-sigma regulatory factor (Ser/Thr protein kinase)
VKPGSGAKIPAYLRITSEPARLAEVRRAVAGIAGEIGFDKEEVSQLVLAVDEALCNVIKHGYACEPGHPIELVLSDAPGAGGAGLEIQVRDYGKQVDPDGLHGRDLEDVRPGGLGLHIIRSTMDEVKFTRAEGGGMRLVMCKYRKRKGGR